MAIKPMSTTDESAHKRTASATSAVQTTPPPAKRPAATPGLSVTALPPARREFPHAVALVLYRDAGDDVPSSTTTVLGVHAGLADANAEVRRLAREQGVNLAGVAANDISPVRWDAPDGTSCWVEAHAVKPKTFVPRTTSAGSSPAEQQPPKKLYDAEEGEDPDLDDDDQDEGGHYD